MKYKSMPMKICKRKAYEWKVYEWKKYTNKKQPSNVFSRKTNGKCTQPNKQVVLSDSKCAWSNLNFGYSNVTIQL